MRDLGTCHNTPVSPVDLCELYDWGSRPLSAEQCKDTGTLLISSAQLMIARQLDHSVLDKAGPHASEGNLSQLNDSDCEAWIRTSDSATNRTIDRQLLLPSVWNNANRLRPLNGAVKDSSAANSQLPKQFNFLASFRNTRNPVSDLDKQGIANNPVGLLLSIYHI